VRLQSPDLELEACKDRCHTRKCTTFFALKCTTGNNSHAGWSFFRHNLTEERVEDLPPGKGAAAAMLLTANASRAANATWTRRVRGA
jgi:hypothetical protein